MLTPVHSMHTLSGAVLAFSPSSTFLKQKMKVSGTAVTAIVAVVTLSVPYPDGITDLG